MLLYILLYCILCYNIKLHYSNISKFDFPFVVKPSDEGSTHGLTIIQKNDDIEGGGEHTEDTATSFGFNDVSRGKSNIVGKTFNLLKALLGGVIGAKLKALLGKFLLVPLLKKFAPGLVPLLKKGGLTGTLRSILPKWLGGTRGAPKVKQLNLFEKGADVATSKPNILQRGAQWLNKQPLVKHTKDALGPHMKKIGPIIIRGRHMY